MPMHVQLPVVAIPHPTTCLTCAVKNQSNQDALIRHELLRDLALFQMRNVQRTDCGPTTRSRERSCREE